MCGTAAPAPVTPPPPPVASAQRVNQQRLPFYMTHIEGLSATATLKISDLINGEIKRALLFNYMIDMDWMVSKCPVLKTIHLVDVNLTP